MKKLQNKSIIALSLFILCLILNVNLVFAGPSSTNFQLLEYSFGSGGTDTTMSSTNFGLFGTTGEVESGQPYSTNYKAGTGLIYTLKLNVPPAPTLSNPGTTYDRLQFILSQGGNMSDATYAISISTDSFSSDIRYVKADGTVGSTLAAADFKIYTNWGGSSGSFVTTLKSNTTYYVRAKARIGNYTETEWGPISTGVATSNSSLTFSLNNSSITFNNLTPADSYTDTQSTIMTTSTNAYSGYSVYARENQSLKTPDNHTISDYSGTNALPTTWSGTGFGYTTSDSNLGGTGGINRFLNGTKYAGFSQTGPGDIVADDPGPVQSTPISNEHFTVTYQVVGNSTTPSGTYTNIILYTIVPTF